MGLFTREFAGVAREVKKGVGGVLSAWPKYRGKNVVIESATSSLGTAEVVDLPEAPDEPQYSRIDITLSAGECPEFEANENLTIEWTDTDGNTGREELVYDVVRSPIGLLVSFNQMRQARADLNKVLTRLGEMLVETGETALTPEDVASIYAASARVEIQDRLRMAAREQASSRLALVLDRDRLVRMESALAVAHCYEAIAKDPAAGNDVDSAQAREFRRKYEVAWQQLGPLVVDEDEDGVGDETRQRPTIGLVRTTRTES